MKITVFGKNLFEIKKEKSNALWGEITNPAILTSKFLPDFYKRIGNGTNSDTITTLSEYVIIPDSVGGAVAVEKNKMPGAKKPEVKKKEEAKITPKGVHELKMLNDLTFVLKTDPKYVDEQLETFKDKLSLIKSSEYDMRNGVEELSSIVTRLENRKKYGEHKEFFEQFPYTMTSKINEVTKKHDHLKLGLIEQFIADMPKEAVNTMKLYDEYTKKVCGKQAVYYIIADKKDFKKTDRRRDPILLAQSPFGHFWQILGAWDDEMIFVDEL